MATAKSAVGDRIMALLPPNSSKLLPKRAATATATALPMRVLPVADTNGTRTSLASHSPTSRPPTTKLETPSGTALARNTS